MCPAPVSDKSYHCAICRAWLDYGVSRSYHYQVIAKLSKLWPNLFTAVEDHVKKYQLPSVSSIVKRYADEIQGIIDNRTTGDFTWEGLLVTFLNDVETELSKEDHV